MCEIYMHPCKVCGVEIQIHLGDYDIQSSEIEVFCKDHLPNENVIIWESLKNRRFSQKASLSEIYTYKNVGIRPLTENAKLNKNNNHPNTDCKIIKERK